MQKKFDYIKTRHKFIIILWMIIFPFLFTSLLISTTFVQNKLVKYSSDYLSDLFKTKVNIKKIKLSLFNGIILNGVYIEDLQKDTLLYAGEICAIPKSLNISAQNIPLLKIKLDSVYFHLKEDSTGRSNMQFIFDALDSGSPPDTTASSFHLTCNAFDLKNTTFSYKVYKPDSIAYGMNFEDFYLRNINLSVFSLDVLNDVIKLKINSASLKDKSGMNVQNLYTTAAEISGKGIYLKNLALKTSKSDMQFDSLNLVYKSWDSFNNFITDVEIQSSFRDTCRFSLADLAYFVPDFRMLNREFIFRGRIKGPISNLRTDSLTIKYGKKTELIINSRIKNLPDFEKLEFDINVVKLNTDRDDLISFPSLSDSSQNLIELPKELNGIGTLSYSGKTVGKSNKFKSRGKMISNLGTIVTDINADTDSIGDLNIEGILTAVNLQIGKIMGNEKDFGQLTFNQKIDFSYLKTKKIKLKTFGTIDSVLLNKYNYKNIKLYASMCDMKFDSINLLVNVPDLQMDFNGKVDLSIPIPEFHFNFDLSKANLNNLHLEKADSISNLSFAVKADFKGTTLDDINGEIDISKPLNYKSNKTELNINQFHLNSRVVAFSMGSEIKRFNLTSDYFDMEINGQYRFESLINSANKIISNLLPSFTGKIKENPNTKKIPNPSNKLENVNDFSFVAVFKNANKVTKIFLPSLKLSNNTTLKGYYSSIVDSLNIAFNSKEIKYDDMKFENFYFLSSGTDKKLNSSIGSSKFNFTNENKLENFDVTTKISNDSVNFKLTWNNKQDSALHKANIIGMVTFPKKQNNKNVNIFCELNESNVIISDTIWNISKSSILIDSTSICIKDLNINNKKQKLYLDGYISEYEGDLMFAEITDFNLNNLKPVLGNDMTLSGIISGKTRVSSLYGKPLFFTNDTIQKLIVNDIPLGDIYVNSNWNTEKSSIHFGLYSELGTDRKVKIVQALGDYIPENGNLDIDINIEDFRLKAIQHYYSNYITTGREAQIWGKVKVSGTIENPKYKADLMLKRGGFKVVYTNVQYDIDDVLNFSVSDNLIEINKAKIYSDKQSGFAWLSGKIHHKNFDSMKLDFRMDAENLMLLNTEVTDTSYFYGNVYGSGSFVIKGPIEKLKIDVSLKTENNTKLFVPLMSSSLLSDENSYITFKTNKEIEDDDDKTTNESEVSGPDLDINLEVTPGAELQMIMNAQSGDIMKVKGRGDLKLNMNTLGEISLYGLYTITKGDYLFTMKNVFSKFFDIRTGGTIQWSGDPMNANMDLTASYNLKKVSIYTLNLDENNKEAKTPVSCLLKMSGKLMNPNLKFGVEIPSGNETAAQQLKALDQDALNKQFLSLLLMSTFQPLPGMSQEAVGASPINTGEVLSNQLNHWLSQVSKGVDIGVNYQTGDNVTTDEFDVALSTDLWNDRISINGNVGMGGTTKQPTSSSSTNSIVGDVEVDLKINKSGTVRLKAFNKANDNTNYDKGPYTQGVGIFWRRDFNSLFKKKTKKEEQIIDKKK